MYILSFEFGSKLPHNCLPKWNEFWQNFKNEWIPVSPYELEEVDFAKFQEVVQSSEPASVSTTSETVTSVEYPPRIPPV